MRFEIKTDIIKDRIQTLKRDFLVYYPIKANANHKLLSFIDTYVDGYETDSLNHIALLIRSYKVSPDRIIYSYPLKGRKEICEAIKLGISTYVIDDINECQILTELAPYPIKIIVRINVGQFVDVGDKLVKWGMDTESAKNIESYFKDIKHRLFGYSFYLPQELSTLQNFERIIEGLFDEFIISDGSVVDIGGGVSDEMLLPIAEKLLGEKQGRDIKFIIEPGRHLLNPAIDMHVQVLDVRYVNNKKLVFIDSGIYHGLLDVILKGVKFNIASMRKGKLESCIVCGDSSDISDIIGEYDLPANIKRGDSLIIADCGAYCEEFIMPFCKNKKPTIKLT